MLLQNLISNLTNASVTVTHVDTATRIHGVTEADLTGIDELTAWRFVDVKVTTETGISFSFNASVRVYLESLSFNKFGILDDILKKQGEFTPVSIAEAMAFLHEDNIIAFDLTAEQEEDEDFYYYLYDNRHPEIDLQEVWVSDVVGSMKKDDAIMSIVNQAIQESFDKGEPKQGLVS